MNSNDKCEKAHSPAYLHLKKVAERLASDYNKVLSGGHTDETVASVRAHCIREWDAAVYHVVSASGLACKAGAVQAARRRLRDAKHLLPFLESEARQSRAA